MGRLLAGRCAHVFEVGLIEVLLGDEVDAEDGEQVDHFPVNFSHLGRLYICNYGKNKENYKGTFLFSSAFAVLLFLLLLASSGVYFQVARRLVLCVRQPLLDGSSHPVKYLSYVVVVFCTTLQELHPVFFCQCLPVLPGNLPLRIAAITFISDDDF